MTALISVSIVFSLFCVSEMSKAAADPGLTSYEQTFADHTWPTTCGFFDKNGVTLNSTAFIMSSLNNPGGIPMSHTPYVLNYTVHEYCPRHWPALVAIGEWARNTPTTSTTPPGDCADGDDCHGGGIKPGIVV